MGQVRKHRPEGLLNSALKPLLKYVSNADVDRDLAQDLNDAFGDVPVEEVNAETSFVATACKVWVTAERFARVAVGKRVEHQREIPAAWRPLIDEASGRGKLDSTSPERASEAGQIPAL